MDNFAPVLIPTLNRHLHFKRCVESLSECTHAEQTDLFIALDYPLNDSHLEGYEIIKAYLPEIKGFNSVNIIERQKNFGAENNFESGIKTIYEKYDRMIFSEDDNEFSLNFLDYMNKGLDKFENDNTVLAICGYIYPVTINCQKQYNYFYGKGFSAWGYGTWRNRNIKWVYNISELKKLKKNNEFKKKIKYYDERHYFNMLNYISEKKDPTGDRAVVIYLIEKNIFCIFPVVTKVKNWGHDGSGIHCDTIQNNIYIKQKIDINSTFEYSHNNPSNDSYLNSVLIDYFKIPLQKKLKLYIKRSVVYKILNVFWK